MNVHDTSSRREDRGYFLIRGQTVQVVTICVLGVRRALDGVFGCSKGALLFER